MITIFPHIRRTGGSTLRLLMDRQFPGRTARCGPEYWDALHKAPAEIDPRGEALAWYGHHPYGLHEHLDGPTQYIALLRDPLARLKSVWQRRQHRYPGSTLVDCAEGIAGNGPRQTDTVNVATRILSGAGAREELIAKHLGAAKRNLRSFALVGFTENFRAFAARLRYELGWSTVDPDDIPRENAGPPPRAICPREVEDLLASGAAALDFELYTWARGEFG